jgi:hypothetical protein
VICWLSGWPATPWIWAVRPFWAFGNAVSVALAAGLDPVVLRPLIVIEWAVPAAAAALVDELVDDALAVLDDELLEPQPASASVTHAAPAANRQR